MEPHTIARAEELSLQINRLHVNYLQADESPQKIEQRSKLESYIRKYLCLVAHGRKFIFPETAEVLRCSVDGKSNFSAYRASTAWNAIARYAANLVAQPWRKEFRVIKTFSGFYMHDVEENLVYAERLLDCLGYRRVDHTSLVLEQPIDIDAVINVSRDAVVAFVECQIMKEIWEGVYPQFECSWSEILNFRENHICTPESAIKSLLYLYHQNCFHSQQMLAPAFTHDLYSSNPRFHHQSPQSNCLYGQAMSPQMNVAYYGYSSFPSCVVPSQPRYACVINPQQVVGYPTSPTGYHHQHTKSPVQILPPNGYQYSQQHPGVSSTSGQNGYVMAQPAATLPNYSCVVPTAQLIELDNNSSAVPSSRPNRIAVGEDVKCSETRNGNANRNGERLGNVYSEGALSKRDSPTSTRSDGKSIRPTTLEDLKPRRNGVHVDQISPTGGAETLTYSDKYGGAKPAQRHTSRKSGVPVAPMRDGTGTWESWDYVYRNLESQGYNKDVGERGDILHSSTFPRRGSIGSAETSPNVNNIAVRNSSNSRDVEVSASIGHPSHLLHLSDGIQSMQLNCEDPPVRRGTDIVDSRSGACDVKSSSAKDKAGTKAINSANKSAVSEQNIELDSTFSSALKNGQENFNGEERMGFWECVFCTYHNKTEKFVCEICGKSRQPGNEEKPLISGGRECPKCTLVNARGVVSCEACHESLKNSPTYI